MPLLKKINWRLMKNRYTDFVIVACINHCKFHPFYSRLYGHDENNKPILIDQALEPKREWIKKLKATHTAAIFYPTRD